jgi:RimJ/RimL family protein N-acetyltransferase
MALYPTYPLLTERLRLRPFTRGDVDAVFAYRQREDVARYLFGAALGREECALAVQQRINQTTLDKEGDKVVLAMELGQTSQLIGEVSLIWRSLESEQGEVGWILHPDYHGHGYATEAAGVILNLAFGEAQLHRVVARCAAENGPSFRLMERLGMRREAHFRDHSITKGVWDEEFIYAILRDEWLNRQSQSPTSG